MALTKFLEYADFNSSLTAQPHFDNGFATGSIKIESILDGDGIGGSIGRNAIVDFTFPTMEIGDIVYISEQGNLHTDLSAAQADDWRFFIERHATDYSFGTNNELTTPPSEQTTVLSVYSEGIADPVEPEEPEPVTTCTFRLDSAGLGEGSGYRFSLFSVKDGASTLLKEDIQFEKMTWQSNSGPYFNGGLGFEVEVPEDIDSIKLVCTHRGQNDTDTTLLMYLTDPIENDKAWAPVDGTPGNYEDYRMELRFEFNGQVDDEVHFESTDFCGFVQPTQFTPAGDPDPDVDPDDDRPVPSVGRLVLRIKNPRTGKWLTNFRAGAWKLRNEDNTDWIQMNYANTFIRNPQHDPDIHTPENESFPLWLEVAAPGEEEEEQ